MPSLPDNPLIDTDPTYHRDETTYAALQAWRARALNLILIAVAIVSLPALTAAGIESAQDGQMLLALALYPACYLFILVLAFYRRLDLRLRGWGLLLLGYLNGVLAFQARGLAGSGPTYVIMMPVAAFILVSGRSGWLATGLSLLIYVSFALFAHLGLLENWLNTTVNPVELDFWITPAAVLAMLLITAVILLDRFHRLQIRTLAAAQQAAAELQRANERLEDYNRTLEQKVTERTAELEDAMQMAERARLTAEAANQAKSAFLNTMSHELRTPLTSVLGFARVIQKRLEDVLLPLIISDEPKVERAVRQVHANTDIIVSESQRLKVLIDDLLDLAKIEAGKVSWNMRPVSIQDLIERSVAATAGLFETKPLELVVDVAPELPMIVGDHNRLIQVLVNLISNAVKFTQQGSITCRARQTNGDITVSVIDSGIGVAAADQPRVFERFVQIGDVIQDKPRGTGLGLPICQSIVEHHGGRIWVESAGVPGQGSTFSFTLPVPEESTVDALAIDDIVQQLKQQVVATVPDEPRGQRTVLVVDDEPHIRELLRQELEAEGYQVRQAKDGREALAQVQYERPSLIIMDVMMPGLSGFEVTNMLKTSPETADIPILILSILEDKEKGFRLGADGYLIKPLDTEKLLQAVAALVRRAELEEQVAEPGRKVLVIDRDASLIAAIASVLQGQGYEVVQAYDGQDGLDKARQEHPDLVIVDATISQMNDHEVLRALKYETDIRDASVIVLTTAQVEPDDASGQVPESSL